MKHVYYICRIEIDLAERQVSAHIIKKDQSQLTILLHNVTEHFVTIIHEDIKCIQLFLYNKYGCKKLSVLELIQFKRLTQMLMLIRVDTRVATSTKLSANRPNIVV